MQLDSMYRPRRHLYDLRDDLSCLSAGAVGRTGQAARKAAEQGTAAATAAGPSSSAARQGNRPASSAQPPSKRSGERRAAAAANKRNRISPPNRRSGRPNLRSSSKRSQHSGRPTTQQRQGRTAQLQQAAAAGNGNKRSTQRLSNRSRRNVRSAPQQQQPQRSQQQASAWQQKKGWAPQGAWQAHSTLAAGRQSTMGQRSSHLGDSAGAMAASTFPRPALTSLSGINTRSESAVFPRCTWGIRASPTAAIRSCWWIPFRETGPPTGMTAITFTSHMTTGTTFTTAGIRVWDLRSRSCLVDRCKRRPNRTTP